MFVQRSLTFQRSFPYLQLFQCFKKLEKKQMLNGEIYSKLFQKYLAASAGALVEEQLCINGQFILHVLFLKEK